MKTRKYGVVYTPERLADFAAELMYKETVADKFNITTILDPACGECALLRAAEKLWGSDSYYYGIDIDNDVVENNNSEFEIIHNDAILPKNVKRFTDDFWRDKLPNITAIIANPPWSSKKIYERNRLKKAGFTLVDGQYDSYVLFIELSLKILTEGGYISLIIPDSLFDAQNEKLREFLLENTQIRVIARLGEKIFDEVNRATTVIVCKKEKNTTDSITKCFRLSTDSRKKFLATNETLMSFYNKAFHEVRQNRFIKNKAHNFDIDTHSDEETLLTKIAKDCLDWDESFVFGRGVEISKSGKIVKCDYCGYAQGYKKAQLKEGCKICINCGKKIDITSKTVQNVVTKQSAPGTVRMFVGEHIKRYGIVGEYFIQPNIQGINYKDHRMYNPPKLLVRKTGLGIYSSIDYTGSMTSQTVYILKRKDEDSPIPLEYYLALLNSRVVYYYYLKVYGENEWKSHPYLTKQIIYSLPLKSYSGNALDAQIITLATELAHGYTHELDIKLEKLIARKYDLTATEIEAIYREMDRLPDLGAVNDMKVEMIDNV